MSSKLLSQLRQNNRNVLNQPLAFNPNKNFKRRVTSMSNLENSNLNDLIANIKLAQNPIEFTQVMQIIADNYQYQPTAFSNGELLNESGTNEGSCKIFYFAQLNNLTPAQTLACFGSYYREDVLNNPKGNDHQNIRNFMQTGWQGIEFKSAALSPIK